MTLERDYHEQHLPENNVVQKEDTKDNQVIRAVRARLDQTQLTQDAAREAERAARRAAPRSQGQLHQEYHAKMVDAQSELPPIGDPSLIERVMAAADPDAKVQFIVSPLDTQVGGDHYKRMAIQPVEFIEANQLGYLEGNVIKYVSRHASKNGVADLDKAIHYLQLLKKMRYGSAE